MTNKELNKYLEEKFQNSKDLTALYKTADGYFQSSHDHRREFILTVAYLQRSELFRSDKQFKTATFKDFIVTKWNLDMKRYQEELYAFTSFPDEAQKYGIGTITTISKACGKKQARAVIEQINSLPNATQTAIKTVIAQHKTIRPAAQQTETKTALLKEIECLEGRLKNEISIYDELNERYERLKQTLSERDTHIARLSIENEKLKAEISKLKSNQYIPNMPGIPIALYDSIQPAQ